MQVIYITQSFGGRVEAGTGYRAYLDVKSLLDAGVRVHLVSETSTDVPRGVVFHEADQFSHFVQEHSLYSKDEREDICKTLTPPLAFSYSILGPVLHICRTEPVDAVIVNDDSALAYSILQWRNLFPWELRSSVFVMARHSVKEENMASRLNPWAKPTYWLWQLQEKCWKLADGVVCDTKAMSALVTQAVPEARAHVVDPELAISVAEEACESRLATPGENAQPTFLFHGELSARNRVDVLVEAFALARAKISNAKLVLHGPVGTNPPVFERFDNYLVRKHGQLLGHAMNVRDSAPFELGAGSHAGTWMVFPQATTSLTAFDLSAINSDIPCIVNSRSPIRDMLTEAGVVAAAMDSAEDMADALIEAAASPVPEKRNIRPSGNEGLARFLATQCVEGRKPASRPDTAVAVSAVVTCFNLGPYIGEALRSLWSTLDRNRDEIIVVDDGSTDQATIQVLDELSEQGECKLIRTRNRGVSLARNTGIAAAKNEFVLICDGDDGVKPEFARRALQVLLTHPKAGAVYAWRLHVPNMNGLVRIQWDFEVPWGLCSNPGGSLILLRKNAFATTPGYSHEMRYNYEDWEILVSLREKGWECLAIPQCLAISRMRNDSKLQSLSAWRRTHVLERMISLHEKLFSDAAPSLIRLAQANTDYFWYASQPASSVTPSTVKSAHAAIQAMERALAHAESLGLRRVAIYGCGAHSRKAAEAFASAPVEIAGFIDDKPSMLKFLGWPVHSLDDVGSLGVDAIILSSDTIEDKLFENIRACPAGAGIAVVRPYVDTKGLRSQNGNGNLNRDAAIRMGQGLRKAEESGRKRIAVYGIGRHTQKAVQALAEARGRIVGFVDEGDRAASTFMGWPVRGLGEIQSLNPDALIMSVGPDEEKELATVAESIGGSPIEIIPLYSTTSANAGPDPANIPPRIACMRMKRALSSAVAQGCKRIAVYGAGSHSVKVLDALLEYHTSISTFLDDRAKAGARFMGWPVVNPDAIQDIAADAIVISSDSAENILHDKAVSIVAGANIPIFRLYS